MIPSVRPSCPPKRAVLLVVAVLLLGGETGLPAAAQASGPAPGLQVQASSVVFAQSSRARAKQAQEEEAQSRTWIVVVVVVVILAALIGGAVFLFLNQQGGKEKKPKVAESADAVGGYRFDKMLHQGPVSQVYEVVEIVSGRHFAMKRLLEEKASDAVQRQLLFNEADIGIEMAHPNVVKIVKVFKQAKIPCFVMEFFPSGSVRQRIMYKDWDYIKAQAHNIMKQSATALAYMTSNGYLHRDIKPDNILVNGAGDVKLIDFAISEKIPTGLARMFTRKSKRNGTRSYMSPEAIRCEPLDTRSEIYSFGATCYEIVTFRTPFRAAAANDLLNKHLFEKPTPPQVYCPDLTDECAKLILRMLAKKKEERFQNFHEVLMELRKIKIFKNANPQPPKDGGPLALHPEALSAMRRPTGKPAAPKTPGQEAPSDE